MANASTSGRQSHEAVLLTGIHRTVDPLILSLCGLQEASGEDIMIKLLLNNISDDHFVSYIFYKPSNIKVNVDLSYNHKTSTLFWIL